MFAFKTKRKRSGAGESRHANAYATRSAQRPHFNNANVGSTTNASALPPPIAMMPLRTSDNIDMNDDDDDDVVVGDDHNDAVVEDNDDDGDDASVRMPTQSAKKAARRSASAFDEVLF